MYRDRQKHEIPRVININPNHDVTVRFKSETNFNTIIGSYKNNENQL